MALMNGRCTACLGDTLVDIPTDMPSGARVLIQVCASCDLRVEGAPEPSKSKCACGNLLTITHPTQCKECTLERSM